MPPRLSHENIVYPLFDKGKCISCVRCSLSCRDGGHQAIEIVDDCPYLDGRKCVGCLLCSLVCSVGDIYASKHVGKVDSERRIIL